MASHFQGDVAMKSLIFLSLVILNMLLSPVSRADPSAWSQALQGLERINGFEADAEIKDLIPAFEALPADPDQKAILALFEAGPVEHTPG
jgi:hypothetical protein